MQLANSARDALRISEGDHISATGIALETDDVFASLDINRRYMQRSDREFSGTDADEYATGPRRRRCGLPWLMYVSFATTGFEEPRERHTRARQQCSQTQNQTAKVATLHDSLLA
jgi:hypothetical protein